LSLSDTLLLISILAPILAPLSVALYRFLLAKLPAEAAGAVEHTVALAVTAVEQSSPGLAGDDKKAKAVALVSEMCQHLGLRANPVVVSALIEATVHSMNAELGHPGSAGPANPMGFAPEPRPLPGTESPSPSYES
jgi:hypothetical protein